MLLSPLRDSRGRYGWLVACRRQQVHEGLRVPEPGRGTGVYAQGAAGLTRTAVEQRHPGERRHRTTMADKTELAQGRLKVTFASNIKTRCDGISAGNGDPASRAGKAERAARNVKPRRSLRSVVDIRAASLARIGKHRDLGAELGQRISANVRQRHPPKPPVVTPASELEWNAEKPATRETDIHLTNPRRPGSLPTEFSRNTIVPFGATFRGCGVFLALAGSELRMSKPDYSKPIMLFPVASSLPAESRRTSSALNTGAPFGLLSALTRLI